MTRRVIQIAMSKAPESPCTRPPNIIALCNDGAMFNFTPAEEWCELPGIPQSDSGDDVVKLRAEIEAKARKLLKYEEQINELADLTGELMGSNLKAPGGAARYNVGTRMAKILDLYDMLEAK